MAIRISASLILLISVLFLPFWVLYILAFLGMVYFNIFWEAVILMLLSDFLYGIAETKFYGIFFISFIISIIILIALEFFKKKLKFYP